MASGFTELIDFFEDLKSEMINATIIAGQGLLGDINNRIHVDGLDANGGQIGTGYSSKPYYSAISRFINKSGIPKENVSKNGLWVQLPEAYKSFREYSGRQTNKVDLKYTGNLQNSMLLIQTETGFVIGYPSVIIGGDSENSDIGAADLAEILEDQYGTVIFAASESEIDEFILDLLSELQL